MAFGAVTREVKQISPIELVAAYNNDCYGFHKEGESEFAFIFWMKRRQKRRGKEEEWTEEKRDIIFKSSEVGGHHK